MRTISLTSKTPRPLKFELPGGGTIRWVFRKLMGREERQKLLKKHGKGRASTEIMDFKALVSRAVEYVELGDIAVTDAEGKEWTGKVERWDIIRDILDSPEFPDEMFERVIEHIMGENQLGEAEGNS